MLALIGPDIRTRYESGYRLHSFGLLRVYSLVGWWSRPVCGSDESANCSECASGSEPYRGVGFDYGWIEMNKLVPDVVGAASPPMHKKSVPSWKWTDALHLLFWWRRVDLNHRPKDYEAFALTA